MWGGGGFDADDLALDLFAFGGLDFGFVAVDLVVDFGAHDKVGGVHGLSGVGATGVGLALRFEGEVVGLVLVFFVRGAGGLRVFEGGVALDLGGRGGEGGQDCGEAEDCGDCFAHGSSWMEL